MARRVLRAGNTAVSKTAKVLTSGNVNAVRKRDNTSTKGGKGKEKEGRGNRGGAERVV